MQNFAIGIRALATGAVVAACAMATTGTAQADTTSTSATATVATKSPQRIQKEAAAAWKAGKVKRITFTGGDAKAGYCGQEMSVPVGTWVESKDIDFSIWGSPGLMVNYAGIVQPGANANILVHVKGYDPAGRETWTSVGMTSSVTRGSTHWGNSAAMPAVRVYNAGPALAVPVSWRCMGDA